MPALEAALPAGFYRDDAHWRREREQVLFREWFCAGRVADVVPRGCVAVIDVAGESVLVTRTAAGVLHGHYNVCRHRGCQLLPVAPGVAVPAQRMAALRCPYHSWTYGVDGRLLRAPYAEDLTAFAPEEFRLHPVGVAEWAGFLFLHLTPESAPSLDTDLAEISERVVRYPLATLQVGAQFSYDVVANWKLLLENYNECYHCGPVHPELCRLVPAFGRGGGDLDWEGGIPHREGAWTFTATGTTDRVPFPDLDAEERVRHKGELIYPNLLLSLSADHAAAFVLWPQACDRTRVDCLLLFAADERARPSFDPSDAAEFWDRVNRQDWAICEAVQRGLSSRAFRQGWFAPMEDASADIRRWLLPRLDRS